MLPWKADPVLSFGTDTFMTAAFLLCEKSGQQEGVWKPPEALAMSGPLGAVETGALSVLAGISFLRSCSWHSGPPKDDCNEVLFPD